MTGHAKALDITNMPEVRRLAEEVSASREPRILRSLDKDLVVVSPLRGTSSRRGRRKSDADLAAFRSAAGGWMDVDTDKLVNDIYETRRRSNRPPFDV
jgi:hypothetical protein